CNTCLDSGCVKKVAVNHISVVNKTTKGYSAQSGKTPVPAANRKGPTAVSFNTMEIIPESNMAVISLQSFILNQNHLKLNMSTVPAPNTKSTSNNCRAFCKSRARPALKTINITVEILPTATNLFSEAFGLICCL